MLPSWHSGRSKRTAAYRDSVTDYLAVAVLTRWGNRLDRAFKAVKRAPGAGSDDLEPFIVFVTADFAFRH